MTQNPPAPVAGLPRAAKRELDTACRLTADRRADAHRLFRAGGLRIVRS
jgi:hypothetical protein